LWAECFNFIFSNQDYFKFMFAHNLGSFDGFFIYKALINYCTFDSVKTIIDNKNKFITINYNNNQTKWLDSYRIFPVSLEELCKVFNVTGKSNSYNLKYSNI
jgi:hypothetical protein